MNFIHKEADGQTLMHEIIIGAIEPRADGERPCLFIS